MMFLPHDFLGPLDGLRDDVPAYMFMLNPKFGRRAFSKSGSPFVCAHSGRRIEAEEQKTRVGDLARALAAELGWQVNAGTEMDKVAVIYSYNTIDALTISWALHRLNGVSAPANPAYTEDELYHQLKTSNAKALFTCVPLLAVARRAAARHDLPESKIFICELSDDEGEYPQGYTRLSGLLHRGSKIDNTSLKSPRWKPGQGARQIAFLCYSSGTSGLPKAVMITHQNVIANVLQASSMDKDFRSGRGADFIDVQLGLMPQSHVFGLIAISHLSVYRGDTVVVFKNFNLESLLAAIPKFKISTLNVVPPIIVSLLNNPDLCTKYDLSTVQQVQTGAAPLGRETAHAMATKYPDWVIRQGYGMTETCCVASNTLARDVWLGSSGCLMPGFEAKLISPEGEQITGYNKAGELLLRSPSVVPGYLGNAAASAEAFIDLPDGQFLRTGDEAEFRKSPNGLEHVWIIDRIKELIKVKGLQVAPAELEALLLEHPAVSDCAVIGIPDDRAGEVPKAFIVRSRSHVVQDPAKLAIEIGKHVSDTKARHKWLTGGVEFVDVIPKSPSGKILRRHLRDQEREKKRLYLARL